MSLQNECFPSKNMVRKNIFHLPKHLTKIQTLLDNVSINNFPLCWLGNARLKKRHRKKEYKRWHIKDMGM